jgi:hypothetical protein
MFSRWSLVVGQAKPSKIAAAVSDRQRANSVLVFAAGNQLESRKKLASKGFANDQGPTTND